MGILCCHVLKDLECASGVGWRRGPETQATDSSRCDKEQQCHGALLVWCGRAQNREESSGGLAFLTCLAVAPAQVGLEAELGEEGGGCRG